MPAAAVTIACNPFDRSQVPEVRVGTGLRPEISWTPSPAYQLQVYEGAEDRKGIGVLWTVGGPGGYENTLDSPVTYGVPPPGSQYAPAPPLQAGRTYTVTVTRKDEKGSGDGFFNTRNRYVGVRTFVSGPSPADPPPR
jgi:hypothetical protein